MEAIVSVSNSLFFTFRLGTHIHFYSLDTFLFRWFPTHGFLASRENSSPKSILSYLARITNITKFAVACAVSSLGWRRLLIELSTQLCVYPASYFTEHQDIIMRKTKSERCLEFCKANHLRHCATIPSSIKNWPFFRDFKMRWGILRSGPPQFSSWYLRSKYRA